MDNLRLCDSEYKFMTLIWDSAPIGSGELVRLSLEKLGWKKSTTYTVIKKLCEKGCIKNENSTVSVLIPKEKIQLAEAEYFVDRTFNGSLSHLVAAFFECGKVSDKEAEQLKRLIDESRR